MNGNTKFLYEQYWHERIKKSKNEVRGEAKLNEIFETASSALTEGNRILDVGCGDGSFLTTLKINSGGCMVQRLRKRPLTLHRSRVCLQP